MFKIRLFPLLILVLGLAMTSVISLSVFRYYQVIEMQSFESKCRGVESKIQIQLKACAQTLYSSSAFIAGSDSITRTEWNEFQTLNKSLTELPGIQGIGYITIVPRQRLAHFEKQIKEEGLVDFKIRPEGDRESYTTVIYLEPFKGKNVNVIGYDAFTETVRQKVMISARDHDVATISDKIILIQDADQKVAGALMVAPVFKRGAPKATIEERKVAIKGWVFSAFRMNDFISQVITEWDYNEIRLRIFDESKSNPENLLFDSDYLSTAHSESPYKEFDVKMNFNGKTWILNFNRYHPTVGIFSTRAVFVFGGGIIISILLFILTVSLINARTKSIQIQLLNEELKKVNVNKDRFISVLAHDLKNPFNALLGFSELIDENFESLSREEHRLYASQVHSTAKTTYSLLEELLMWARVQSGQFSFNPQIINLNQLCKNLVEDFIPMAAQKNISISIEESGQVSTKADELMLKTILRNLITNAIKFTRAKGSILVRTKIESDQVIVSIVDNGIGISDAEQRKLFDITQVNSKTGTANEKGTGLGLLLCHDLVEKHGGKIWVESIVDHGSTFSFSLPILNSN